MVVKMAQLLSSFYAVHKAKKVTITVYFSQSKLMGGYSVLAGLMV